uniref:CNH domain-containing protein n=1 Tax=Syphacia muris TaxID=451379 RepID=A0A0N5AWP4_9BILA
MADIKNSFECRRTVFNFQKTTIIGTLKFCCSSKDGRYLYYDEEKNKMIIRQLQNPSAKEHLVEVIERFHIRKYYWLYCKFVSKSVVLAILIKHDNKHIYLASFKLDKYMEILKAVLVSKIDTRIAFSTVQIAVQASCSGDFFYLQGLPYSRRMDKSSSSEKAIMLAIKCNKDGSQIKCKWVIIGKRRPTVRLEPAAIGSQQFGRFSFQRILNYFFDLQNAELKYALYQDGYVYFVDMSNPSNGFVVETFLISQGYFAKLSYLFKSFNLLGSTETVKPLARQMQIDHDERSLPPSPSAAVIWSSFFSDSSGSYLCIQEESLLTLWRLAILLDVDENENNEESPLLLKQTDSSSILTGDSEANGRTPVLTSGRQKLTRKLGRLKWINTGLCCTVPRLQLQNNCAIIFQDNQLLVQCSSSENGETKFYLVKITGIKS